MNCIIYLKAGTCNLKNSFLTLRFFILYIVIISKFSDLEIRSCYFHKFSLGSILLYSMKLNKIKVFFF